MGWPDAYVADAIAELGGIADESPSQTCRIQALLVSLVRESRELTTTAHSRPPREPLPSGLVRLALANLGERWCGDIDLSGLDLTNLQLDRLKLDRVLLSNSRLDGTSLRAASLRTAEMTGVSLHQADLSEADLTLAKGLDEEQLSEAKLAGAKLPSGLSLKRD